MKGNDIRKIAQDNQLQVRLLAKLIRTKEKTFKVASEEDQAAISLAEQDVLQIDENLIPTTNVDVYSGRGKQRGIGLPHQYGIHKFRDFFNARQLLAITTIMKWINEAKIKMVRNGVSEEESRILSLYLACALDKHAEFNTKLTVWSAGRELLAETASRYSFDIGWDFPEAYPFSNGAGSFDQAIELIAKYLDEESLVVPAPVQIWQHDATQPCHLLDGSIDLVVTDPPYYSSIFYAGLADFFYSLLKLSQSEAFPELFKTEATPKVNECVLAQHRYDSLEEADRAYKENLTSAFREIKRVLKPDGICVIVFAHIDPNAWDALITAILDADLQISAAWSISTENSSSFGQGGETLSSTIQIVCRGRSNLENEITYDKFKRELKQALPIEFNRLWNLQFSGVNLDISMLGPAISLFSQYTSIIDLESGEGIPVSELLSFVRSEVLELQWKKLREIYLEKDENTDQLVDVDPITRFYVLFRMEFGQKVNGDGVYQLSRAISLDYKMLEQQGYLQKDKSEFSVPIARNRSDPDQLLAHQSPSSPPSLLDTLHGAELANKANILNQFLSDGQIDAFHPMWALAQLLSNITPIKEERTSLLDLLSSRGTQKPIKGMQSRLL